MTGWRIGYCSGPEEIVRQMTKSIQITTSYGTSFTQKAALAALDGPQSCVSDMVSEYRRRLGVLLSSLKSLGMPALDQGGPSTPFQTCRSSDFHQVR